MMLEYVDKSGPCYDFVNFVRWTIKQIEQHVTVNDYSKLNSVIRLNTLE